MLIDTPRWASLMNNSEEILKYLKFKAWPAVISSNVRINKTQDGTISIDLPPIPIKTTCVWAGFIYIIIVALVYWKDRESLYYIAPGALLSSVSFCVILHRINKTQIAMKPYVIINERLTSYNGDEIEITEVSNLRDVYFTAKNGLNRKGMRVVFIESRDRLIPILWQITADHRWVRPKIKEIADILKCTQEKLIITEVIKQPSQSLKGRM